MEKLNKRLIIEKIIKENPNENNDDLAVILKKQYPNEFGYLKNSSIERELRQVRRILKNSLDISSDISNSDILHKRTEIITNLLKENPLVEDDEIANTIQSEYAVYFKNISIESIKKKINEIRLSSDILLPKTIKITGANVETEISRDKWVKTETNVRALQDKFTEQSKLVKALATELEEKESFISSILDNVPKLPVIKQLSGYKIDNKKVSEDAVMLLSDLHSNEIVDVYEMEGMGEYNFKIFTNRLNFLFEKSLEVIENQRSISNIDKLWIDMLGDMVHGELHQKETNEYALIPTALNTAYVLAQAVARMSSHFKEIELTGVVGNHGRLEQKPPTKRIYNNWDYLVYQVMSIYLKDYNNIKFNIPQSPSCIIDRRSHKFLLTHGDSIKGGFAGIPFYGINRAFSSEQEIRRANSGFDVMELGHYHNTNVLKDGKIIMNGSMVGNSGFNLHKLHTVAEPSQRIFGISDKYCITWERSMQLQHAKETKELKYKFDEHPVFGNLEVV